jgi:hypothetical protein
MTDVTWLDIEKLHERIDRLEGSYDMARPCMWCGRTPSAHKDGWSYTGGVFAPLVTWFFDASGALIGVPNRGSSTDNSSGRQRCEYFPNIKASYAHIFPASYWSSHYSKRITGLCKCGKFLTKDGMENGGDGSLVHYASKSQWCEEPLRVWKPRRISGKHWWWRER